MKISAIVQCTADEFASYKNFKTFYTVVPVLIKSKIFSNITLCIGSSDKKIDKKILNFCKYYKIDVYQGELYNPLKRIIKSAQNYKPDYIIRFLLRQFFLDIKQLKYNLKIVLKNNLDTIFNPPDFNYTFVGDIFKFKSLKVVLNSINKIKNEKKKFSYYKSPAVFFEDNFKKFKTKITRIVIKKYTSKKISIIHKKLNKLFTSENHVKTVISKDNYYSFTKKFIKKCKLLGDISCGQGNGTAEISKISNQTIGFDKNKKYIYNANKKFKKIKGLEFRSLKLPYSLGQNKFDVITSFHTLEHIEKKKQKDFIKKIFVALKKNGKFFIEVPLLLKKPLGKSLFPFHLHEPEFKELSLLLINNGFYIKKAMIKNRHRYENVKINKKGNIIGNKKTLIVAAYFYLIKR